MNQRIEVLFGALLATLVFAGPASAEKVTLGLFGSWSAASWPYLIAEQKGFFAEQNIEADTIFAPSAATLVQQLAAGSLDAVGASGVAEPINAAEKGAPVAIVRLIGAEPNYDLVSKPEITSIEGLKGKMISIGGLTDINRVQIDKMINPHGLKISDFDVTVIGSTGARFAGLQSGAIDATMLVPPFNFVAEKMGFRRLGQLLDYAKDMPQTCMMVYTPWAQKNPQMLKGLITAVNKSIDWFYDLKNRDEAINMMATASKANREEVAESYDFLVKIQHFAKSDAIPRAPFESLIKDMRDLKFVLSDVKLEQIVYPGIKIE